MPGPITAFLAQDHDRLGTLLEQAVRPDGSVDPEKYGAFREGLLRHIAFEEKILLPAIRDARGGVPLPSARQLRIDHGALASLLVPTPTAAILGEIRSILEPHNAVEEDPGGVYETCDALLAREAAGLLERMRNYPAVRVAAHYDGPRALRTAKEALAASAKQAAPTQD